MIRLCSIAVVAFGVGALASAEACTLLESPHKSGSPEAIAEEQNWKKQLASGIASHELVLVGKALAVRPADLSVITAGVAGRWGGEIPSTRSWFEPVRMLKGEAGGSATIYVLSGTYGSTCGQGPLPKPGDTVVVYANRLNGYWFGEVTTTDILPLLEPLLK